MQSGFINRTPVLRLVPRQRGDLRQVASHIAAAKQIRKIVDAVACVNVALLVLQLRVDLMLLAEVKDVVVAAVEALVTVERDEDLIGIELPHHIVDGHGIVAGGGAGDQNIRRPYVVELFRRGAGIGDQRDKAAHHHHLLLELPRGHAGIVRGEHIDLAAVVDMLDQAVEVLQLRQAVDLL